MASTATAKIGINFMCPPRDFINASAKTLQRGRVHVCVILIFSAHSPAETISLGAHASINRPAGRNYTLTILHDNVTSFFHRPHQVEDARIFREVEVHVDFRAAHVGMRRHGVPGATRMEMRDAHYQLATLRTIE